MRRRSIDIRIERPGDERPPCAAVSPVPQDGTQAVLGRQRIRSLAGRLGAVVAAVLVGLHGGGVAAQNSLPPDTFGDEATRTLVERAVAARESGAEGVESYEATLRQRMYVGVTAIRFRRERTLFEHERVARIRWADTGERAIRWIGARTAIPIAGIDTGNPEGPGGMASFDGDSLDIRIGGDEERGDEERDGADGSAEDYLDETDFPGFEFDPGADRLTFGDDWALHPLAESSLPHYRYALGDTLRVELPANDLSLVLYELLVEPTRADFELVAGSLWIDSASAALVRATYRPARPWNMRLDDPEAAAEVPGFVGPIEAEIRYITVESSLQELEFWLPRRFAFEGEARAGGLFRIPITLEWSVGGYLVNEPAFDMMSDGELPEGWQRETMTRTDDDGEETTYTIVVPTTEELRSSPALSEDFGGRTPAGFSSSELDDLVADLEGLMPTYQRFRPRLAWGLEQSQLRFNRVEGISAGVSASTPLGPDRFLDAAVRIGSADRVPNFSLGLRFGPERSEWRLEGYHRLTSMNDGDDPFRLTSSLMNVVFGTDRGEYYRATGATLAHRRRGTMLTSDVGVFQERQEAVERYTEFSLRHLVRGDSVEAIIPADDVNVTGGRARLGWYSGTDPNGLIVTGSVGGEAAFGDAEYQRAFARLSLGHPLPLGLAGALEVEAGSSWGDVTRQRSFFLGSWATLRGFDLNEHFGPSFWRGRAEIATGFAGARLALFSDVGWIGERAAFRFDDPLAGVGAGVSLLDGIVRADVARAVRGGDKWKFYLYLDGLF